MKEHFNLRSLVFYATAIGSVAVLFTVTTAYGEKNLQAPRLIDGKYPLTMNVPSECLQTKPLQLFLQQSGVFLTGSLLPTDASEQAVRIARERPSLSGQWRNDQLTLTGQLDRTWECSATVKLDGKLTQETLTGTLSLSSIASPMPFSGSREVIQPEGRNQEAEHRQ
jgi:hypothetical protein